MRITVETGLLGLHTDIPEGRPAPKRIFKLERTVLDKFGIQAAIGSVIDILKKDPVHGRLDRRTCFLHIYLKFITLCH